jgi:hypothetical protein
MRVLNFLVPMVVVFTFGSASVRAQAQENVPDDNKVIRSVVFSAALEDISTPNDDPVSDESSGQVVSTIPDEADKPAEITELKEEPTSIEELKREPEEKITLPEAPQDFDPALPESSSEEPLVRIALLFDDEPEVANDSASDADVEFDAAPSVPTLAPGVLGARMRRLRSRVSRPYQLMPEGAYGFDIDFSLSAGGYIAEGGGLVPAGVPIGPTSGLYDTPMWGPVGFKDDLMLNQAWMSIERKADTGGDGFDWGARIDMMFGSDAYFVQSRGVLGEAQGTWDSRSDWIGGDGYGIAVPQFYGELLYNNVGVKVGLFDTLMGVEGMRTTDNFFYSRSNSFLWGEPFRHSGVLVDYRGFENFEIEMGWVAGWNTGFERPLDASMFLGKVRWQATESMALSYAINSGDMANISLGAPLSFAFPAYHHTIGMEYDLNEQTHLMVQSNYSRVDGETRTTPPPPGPVYAGTASWASINTTLIYDVSSRLGVGGRLEWFDTRNWAAIPGAPAGDVWEASFGFNLKPNQNLTVRPEVRYDWIANTVPGSPPAPWANIWGAGIDFVLTF